MRAGKEVPVSELKQMIGRGGRNQNEKVAYADIVLENDSIYNRLDKCIKWQ